MVSLWYEVATCSKFNILLKLQSEFDVVDFQDLFLIIMSELYP